VTGDSITALPPSAFDAVKGQARDIKSIDGNKLIIARNNDSLVVLTMKSNLPLK
jgi:hypothetical protein